MRHGRIALAVVGVAVLIPVTAALARQQSTAEIRLVAAGRTVRVASAAELRQALADAQPGDRIQLADGEYEGSFEATSNGTAAQPIVLTGSRAAVLTNPGGYGFHLKANHWRLEGFTVTGAVQGIVLEEANHNVLDRLVVRGIEEEGIRLRRNSADNIVQNSVVRDTGLGGRTGYGEGIYLGSAVSDWDRYTAGQPDRSNRNRILGNTIGPNVRGEAIDVREGTTGGEIRGNVLDGSRATDERSDDSCLDVKGNNYLVVGNTCRKPVRDAFQTHIQLTGWGCENVFRDNRLDTGAGGLGVRVVLDEEGENCGNVVYADNLVRGGQLTNVPVVKDL